MLKSDSLIVTKYARNEFFQKKSTENGSLCSLKHAQNDSFFSEKITENGSFALYTREKEPFLKNGAIFCSMNKFILCSKVTVLL